MNQRITKSCLGLYTCTLHLYRSVIDYVCMHLGVSTVWYPCMIYLLQSFDPPDKLKEKISVLCDLIRSSQHVVVHTGAGISTAAGTLIVYPVPNGHTPSAERAYVKS